MDLFDKCNNFTLAREAIAAGYYPYFTVLDDNSEGTEVVIGGRKVIMIGSNNYLGLTTDMRVRQAAIDATEKYGTSCTGSRFLNGTLELHREAERRLAKFVGKQEALVFSTGMQVNLGTISSLVDRGDIVIVDKEDHASIYDGCRLALGTMKRYTHNDMASLEKVLQGCPEKAGKLVVVDGIFSMGGEIAPLPEIARLSKQYGARLMVDDAHSLGVLGDHGRGTADHFGLTDQVDLIMGTFSKSFASLGGFIAGDEVVMHYVQHHARSFMFSASVPAANVAAVLAALDIMEQEPERLQQLWRNTHKMHAGLKALGFNIGNSQSPVIPIIIGDDMKTIFAWKALFEAGVYTNTVLPPAVPPNSSLLRTSYMATHTEEQLDRVLGIMQTVGKEIGLI
jgi:8-amino-7-oxononanoate synthase